MWRMRMQSQVDHSRKMKRTEKTDKKKSFWENLLGGKRLGWCFRGHKESPTNQFIFFGRSFAHFPLLKSPNAKYVKEPCENNSFAFFSNKPFRPCMSENAARHRIAKAQDDCTNDSPTASTAPFDASRNRLHNDLQSRRKNQKKSEKSPRHPLITHLTEISDIKKEPHYNPCSRATLRLQRGVVPILRDGCHAHTAKECLFSFFSFFLLWLWLVNWLLALPKTRKSHAQTSRTSFPRKETFRAFHPKRLDYKSWSTFFSIPQKRRSTTNFFCFGLSISMPQKSHVDPATPVHPIPKTMFFMGLPGNSLARNRTTRNKSLSATFWLRYRKSMTSSFLVEPFWMEGPKRHFSRMKILEDCTWHFLEFLERPKAVREKHPSPTSGTMLLCQPPLQQSTRPAFEILAYAKIMNVRRVTEVHSMLLLPLCSLTGHLFIRQRWNGDEDKLLRQSFMQPVKVLVASGNLDVGQLKTNKKLKFSEKKAKQITNSQTHRWYELVGNERFQSFHFRLFFRRKDLTRIRLSRGRPHGSPFSVLQRTQSDKIINRTLPTAFLDCSRRERENFKKMIQNGRKN